MAVRLRLCVGVRVCHVIPVHGSVHVWSGCLLAAALLESLWIIRCFRRRHWGDSWFLVAWVAFVASICLVDPWLSAAPLMAAGMIQRGLIPVSLVALVLAVASHQRFLQDQELFLAKAQLEKFADRHNVLRHQIHPHFLFNVLTSIDALSRISPDRVPSLVSRFATFLRLRLEPCPDMFAPFERELETTRAYLDVEQMRFCGTLAVSYDISPETMAWRVPGSVLQMLAENAVKRGFEREAAVDILLAARVDAGDLVVSVSHPGTTAGFDAGDDSIRRYLALHYGDSAEFSLTGTLGTVNASIRIPATSQTHDAAHLFAGG